MHGIISAYMHPPLRRTVRFQLLKFKQEDAMLATPPSTTPSSSDGSDETIDGSGLGGPGAGAIGLSDPMYSATSRKMLDLVNRLHSTG